MAAARRCVVNTAETMWQPWIATGSPNMCLVGADRAQPGLSEHLTAGGVAALFEPAGIVIQAAGRQPQFYPAGDRTNDCGGPDDRLAHALATATCVSLMRTLGTAGGEILARLKSSRTMGCSS
jgi:hypothetical protein